MTMVMRGCSDRIVTRVLSPPTPVAASRDQCGTDTPVCALVKSPDIRSRRELKHHRQECLCPQLSKLVRVEDEYRRPHRRGAASEGSQGWEAKRPPWTLRVPRNCAASAALEDRATFSSAADAARIRTLFSQGCS